MSRINWPIEPTHDPRCEKPAEQYTCDHCGEYFDKGDEQVNGAGETVCPDCWDKSPWFSTCCGYEAHGIDLDYMICGDCHDHCEYEK